MLNRYYVSGTDTGYVIHDTNRILPLPFNFFSNQYAQEVCDRFNILGHREVAEYYYTHKVAGAHDLTLFRKSGKNPYEEWMKKHGDMFK